MCTEENRAQRARPYFLPETIDLDSLPQSVQTALDAIVQPTYEELVLAEVGALERAAGLSVVFLLTEELFDQFDLGRLLISDGSPPKVSGAERERMLRGHLRLVSAKQAAIHALLRIRQFSEEHAATPAQITSSEPIA